MGAPVITYWADLALPERVAKPCAPRHKEPETWRLATNLVSQKWVIYSLDPSNGKTVYRSSNAHDSQTIHPVSNGANQGGR